MEKYLQLIPFLMVKGNLGHGTGIRLQRVFEALIIAAISGVVAGYLTMQKMEIRLDYMEKKIDRMYEDVYKPVPYGDNHG